MKTILLLVAAITTITIVTGVESDYISEQSKRTEIGACVYQLVKTIPYGDEITEEKNANLTALVFVGIEIMVVFYCVFLIWKIRKKDLSEKIKKTKTIVNRGVFFIMLLAMACLIWLALITKIPFTSESAFISGIELMPPILLFIPYLNSVKNANNI